jgi:hypothetical protein
MEHGEFFSRWCGRVAVAALALLILAAGFCLFDLVQNHHGPGDHAMLMDVCCLGLVVPAIVPLLAGLILRGLTASAGSLALATVELAVPFPPPRRTLLA